MRILAGKTKEDNLTLWIAMINFDSLEIWTALNVLNNGRIDEKYTKKI